MCECMKCIIDLKKSSMELCWLGLSCLSRFSSLIIIAWASHAIHILFSSNEWCRWPRQSGRARKDKSLFHSAASIYWCCPQHDGSLANTSFWWHWGCFWLFLFGQRIRGKLKRETVKLCLSTFLCLSACSYISVSWFCLLSALAPTLLILVGTPRTCGFGQRRICLSSLCSNTYYWEWTRPGDQDRSYLLEIWTYFHSRVLGL